MDRTSSRVDTSVPFRNQNIIVMKAYASPAAISIQKMAYLRSL